MLRPPKTRYNFLWDTLYSQSLGREETQALVQAMESGVEIVGMWGGVTLDMEMETLAEYSGQGVCSEVMLYGDTAVRYKEELVTWARSRNWRVHTDKHCHCIVDCRTFSYY